MGNYAKYRSNILRLSVCYILTITLMFLYFGIVSHQKEVQALNYAATIETLKQDNIILKNHIVALTDDISVLAEEIRGRKEETKEEVPEVEAIPNNWESLGEFKITYYCPCSYCCGSWGNTTATGVMPQANHTIAVDPNVIHLGSKVRINGIEYVAEDVGGAIKGNKIDIFVNDHQEALNLGVDYFNVEVWKE